MGFMTTYNNFINSKMYKTISSNRGRRYLVSKIQRGSQLTGSSNISETMTDSINIPTATTMFSGSTFLTVVLSISWDVDVR